MKTLVTAIALFAFVAADSLVVSAYAQAPSGSVTTAPAMNAPAVAPTTPTTTMAAPKKATSHRVSRKSTKRTTRHKTAKSSATKKSTKPATQGSLASPPSAGRAG